MAGPITEKGRPPSRGCATADVLLHCLAIAAACSHARLNDGYAVPQTMYQTVTTTPCPDPVTAVDCKVIG